MYDSGYKCGIYNDPAHGTFNSAFCQAVKENKQVHIQTIIWSAEPEVGVTSPQRAPAFNPQNPNCQSNVWMWQYGRNAATCPIDTNHADTRVLASLW